LPQKLDAKKGESHLLALRPFESFRHCIGNLTCNPVTQLRGVRGQRSNLYGRRIEQAIALDPSPVGSLGTGETKPNSISARNRAAVPKEEAWRLQFSFPDTEPGEVRTLPDITKRKA